MELFDTHAHLDDPALATEESQVLARARQAGVTGLLAVGTTVASSRNCLALARRSPGVMAAVGIHPNYVGEAAAGDWEAIEQLAQEPAVGALGETGLDLYWKDTPLPQQQDYFARHLRLSQRLGLAVVIHQRESMAEILAMLHEARSQGPLRGIMHAFTGTAAEAAECVALGLHISFAGMLTFKNAPEIRAVAANIPADRLLVETDAPYLTPHPFRGKRPNEPAYVIHTAQCLADVRGLTLEALAELTTANARRLLSRAGGE